MDKSIKDQFNREMENCHTFKDLFLTVEKYYHIDDTDLGVLRPVIIQGLINGIDIYNLPLKDNISL